MSKRKTRRKDASPKTYAEIFQSSRGDWGDVNPVTKVIPDKRNKKPKYPHKEEE